MKKCVVWFLSLFLLTGCGSSAHELDAGMALRSRLLQSAGCAFTAEITADYEDQLQRFAVETVMDGKGDVSFTVVSPESISGISGSLTGEGGKITFDDIALHFPLMAEETFSPIAAPWILCRALRSGFLSASSVENGETRLSIDERWAEEDLRLDVWLSADNIPIRADILHEGRRILTVDVRTFRIL